MAADRNILPIQSILNRTPPTTRPRTPRSPPRSASDPSSPASDLHDAASALTPTADGRLVQRAGAKKARDSSDLSYTVPQGPIKYPPYEDLEADQLQLVSVFDVKPFGQIRQWCAHISYSSDKKDVFEKTGRESFHVFVYQFTDPGDGQSYDVMWDYLGGFVRISPFFKCRKHKKTGPAKMLDLNKGLREVTFHMTGGNRIAQGYWVPFHCARAVCATFCHPIAGALIPIFGPSFPQDCVAPGSPRFGRMVIDERIVKEAKHEIAAYRHASLTICSRNNAVTSHPRRHHHSLDAMRSGASLLPAFDPQHQHQQQHVHHSHYHNPYPHHYDSRGDMAYFHPPPPPHHTMPWNPNAEVDNGRYPPHMGSASAFTPVNPQMLRPDPMRAIHPQLILESQQRDTGRLPSPPPAYKRVMPSAEQPMRQRLESDAPPHKRARLQPQMPLKTQDTQRFGHPGPGTPPWHDTPGHASSNIHPALAAASSVPLVDRRAERSSHGEKKKKKKRNPLPERRHAAAPDHSTEYTMEELLAAQVLANITQPPPAATAAGMESKKQQSKPDRAPVPRKRARSI